MPSLPVPVVTIGLLIASNVFMTFAWYGHLKFKATALLHGDPGQLGHRVLRIRACRCRPTASATAISRRAELKTIQEVITLSVFAVFSVLYLKEPLTWNHLVGFGFIALRRLLHLPQMGVMRPATLCIPAVDNRRAEA